MTNNRVIVIGGGAAGFFAAINCAQINKNIPVILLEKTNKVLTKVRVSGGGRCNVTHACYDNPLLVKNYPRGEKELQNVFSRFTTTDTIQWFEKRGVKLKSEPDGRIFPESNSSQTIVDVLMQEAERLGVELKINVQIDEIKKNEDNVFRLRVKDGGSFECTHLVIATGGNSKEEAYNWLKKLGHSINKPVPSLFTFNIPDHPITELMGVSVPNAKVKIANTKIITEGPLLITHWGLSGPAVLKASAWGAKVLNEFNYNFTIHVNWLPKHTDEKIRIEFANEREENKTKFIASNSMFEFPKRLWDYFISKSNITNTTRWADVSKKQINLLINILLNDEYQIIGKTTFKEEFVTCGGVNRKEIDFKKMQSKLVPNLYFAGEVIDVDGVTGGFNFQNAWSTSWIAASSIHQSENY